LVALPVVLLAPVLGMASVASPAVAIAVLAAAVFAAVAFYDLAAGVALFATLIFFETLPGAADAGLGVKLAGLVLVAAALRRSGTPLLLKDHPLLAYSAVFLGAWALASSLWADDVPRAAGAGLRLVLGVALLFVVFAAVREARHARWLLWGYICGAAASAIAGLLGPPAAENRLAGGLGDPNFLAAMLVPGFVFSAFALGWTRQPAQRWLLGACALLFIVAIYLTQSRGGLIALAATLVAALFFGGAARRRFAVLGGVIASVGLVYYAAVAPAEAVGRLGNPGGGSGRADLWSIAREVVADQPVTGVGAGNFPVIAPRYVTETVDLPFVDLVVDTPKVVHNTYLGVLTELGIVGLTAFAVVVLAALALVRRSTSLYARAEDSHLELMSRAVLVALVGMLSAFVFLSGEYEKQLWLLLGLAVALYALARKASNSGPAVSRPDPAVSVVVAREPERKHE
jgi:O-antigen ligase